LCRRFGGTCYRRFQCDCISFGWNHRQDFVTLAVGAVPYSETSELVLHGVET
jgi:hypothetical protein